MSRHKKGGMAYTIPANDSDEDDFFPIRSVMPEWWKYKYFIFNNISVFLFLDRK